MTNDQRDAIDLLRDTVEGARTCFEACSNNASYDIDARIVLAGCATLCADALRRTQGVA